LGKSNNRDLYWTKIQACVTLKEAVEMMEKSPHRTHRRYAPECRRRMVEMSNTEIEKLIAQHDSQEFAKKIMAT
jgi:hypothetical protein